MRGGLLSLTLFSLLSLEGKHGHQKHYLYHIYLSLGSYNIRLVSYHLKVNSTHFLLIMIWSTAMPCIIIFGHFWKSPPERRVIWFSLFEPFIKSKSPHSAQRPKGKLGNTIQRRAVTLRHIAQCMLDIVQYCMVLYCTVFNCALSLCHLGSETDDYHIQISIQRSSNHLVIYLLDGYNFSFPVLSSLRPVQICVNSCSLTQFVFIALKIQYIIENSFGNMFYIL